MASELEIEERPSPNHGPRRGGVTADMVVLHYTGMATAEDAISRLADPASEVSAHYVICPEGRIVRMVAEEKRAWHAGAAAWGAIRDINSHSVGIELVNPGHELGYPPFPESQMTALEQLLAGIRARHRIPAERVVGHACVAPDRKRDPGEKFDWRRLGWRGLAVWLDVNAEESSMGAADAGRFQAAARRFGYAVPQSGAWCPATLAVWCAFCMRFRPGYASAGPDVIGITHIERLAGLWPAVPGA